VVKLWDFETGNFMFEFNKAHGDSAITSITFDTSGRRLITAGRDGAVRIWNYNNGHCLRSLERGNTVFVFRATPHSWVGLAILAHH